MGNSRGNRYEAGRQNTRDSQKAFDFPEKLSEMSGVSYGSIKRFETTGQISLLSLTKLAIALNEVDEIRNLFTDVPYRSIQEVINEGK